MTQAVSFETVIAVLSGEAETLHDWQTADLIAAEFTPAQNAELWIRHYWPRLFAAYDRQSDLPNQGLPFALLTYFQMRPPLEVDNDLMAVALDQIETFCAAVNTGEQGLSALKGAAFRSPSIWFAEALIHAKAPLNDDNKAKARALFHILRRPGISGETRFRAASYAGLVDIAELEFQAILEKTGPHWRNGLELIAQQAPDKLAYMLEPTRGVLLRALLDIDGFEGYAVAELADVLGRLQAIHHDGQPFTPDKVFAEDDAKLVWNLAFVGSRLQRDWVGIYIPQIWRLAAFSPNPKRKTLPSQKLVLGLGHVAAGQADHRWFGWLEETRGVVRHAALSKRLEKRRKEALSAIAERADFALTWPSDVEVPPRLKTPMRKSIEGMLRGHKPVDGSTFAAGIGSNPDLASSVGALIWEVSDGPDRFTAMWLADQQWALIDGNTRPVSDAQAVTLWHPVNADPSTTQTWRDTIFKQKITQPFAQVDREVYRLTDDDRTKNKITRFAGYQADTNTMGAIASGIGWKTDDMEGCYKRPLGGVSLKFMVSGRLFPGAGGHGVTGEICLSPSSAQLQDMPPALLSEMIRDVDLMVTMGVAHADISPGAHAPGAKTVSQRSTIIERVFATPIADGALILDGRHAVVGDIRINLATGHAFQNGETINPKPSKKLWLPFEDQRFDRIVRQISTLLKTANPS